MHVPYAGKIIEVGSYMAYRTPIVGRHLRDLFDQNQLLDNLLQNEGHDELIRRRQHLHIVEDLPFGNEDAAKRRTDIARLATELLEGHVAEMPSRFQQPVEALMEETRSHEEKDIDID